MKREKGSVVIKKYANRRLYNTGTSCYVSLADIFDMVKRGEPFTVTDVKSGTDITHFILTQVIFDQESKGLNVMPTEFLRQVIRFYGHSSGPAVTHYLQHSMQYFIDHQDNMQRAFAGAAEMMPAGGYREILEHQMDWWRKAWSFPVAAPKSDDDSDNSDA
ncbi:MAG: polyhydroxyalkanoate synthesis repressor PhaR [Rickettsiales bacterium]